MIDGVVTQEVEQLSIGFNLVTKQFIVGVEKVNAVWLQGKMPRHNDFNFEEEAKYLDDQVVSFGYKVQGSNQGNWHSC